MNYQSNTLATQTSPYLLQHAENPVHWHAWSPEILEYAQQVDKPILLSIGYSACHWCHVMAHESFEDEETAQVMNELFINIKVDREERPDIDKIYQKAHQLLSQRHGGWPLTMFLAADTQIPFYGGTYFPKTAKYGLPAFKDLLKQIAAIYSERRDEILKQSDALTKTLQAMQESQPSATLSLSNKALDSARQELEKATDKKHGGFGKAPKFPMPNSLERLLRHWNMTKQLGSPDNKALDLACLSLSAMAQGGVYDQIGGGFCRYSVDDYWMIPHFEKMLYDNGPLLSLYTYAWVTNANPLYKRTVFTLINWVKTQMTSPEHGFYSSIDADSEGVEGKFYVWSKQQLTSLIKPEDYELVAAHFGFDREANFEGQWYPHIYQDRQTLAKQFNLEIDSVDNKIEQAIATLFKARASRIAPERDEKILTSWNALMIKGMAIAGRYFGKQEWIDASQNAFAFIYKTMYTETKLCATYKNGTAHLNAYLDDYVFLIDAGLELLQARWHTDVLIWIMQLADILLAQFEDKKLGGFFFTANDHEKLIERPKPYGDESIPAGNGIAAYTLNRLGHLIGEPSYLEAAENTLKSCQKQIEEYPSAYNSLLNAVEEIINPLQIIILRGPTATINDWADNLNKYLHLNRMIFTIPDPITSTAALHHEAESVQQLPEFLQAKKAVNGENTAYICSGQTCSTAITQFEDLLENLNLTT